MKAIVFEVDGIVNVSDGYRRVRRSACAQAIREFGIELTEERLNELRQNMRDGRAPDVARAVLWQAFRPYAQEQGWHERRLNREFSRLETLYRSLVTYTFVEHPQIRALLEELRFNAVDSWGHFPKLAAVGWGGNFLEDALHYHGLSSLFDVVQPEGRLGQDDPRFWEALLNRLGVDPSQVLVVAVSRWRTVAPARRLGMYTMLVNGDWDSGLAARYIYEEAHAEAADFDDMAERLLMWLNEPVINSHETAAETAPELEG